MITLNIFGVKLNMITFYNLKTVQEYQTRYDFESLHLFTYIYNNGFYKITNLKHSFISIQLWIKKIMIENEKTNHASVAY